VRNGPRSGVSVQDAASGPRQEDTTMACQSPSGTERSCVLASLDQWRRQADECRQLAALTMRAEDKAFWLRLAENWARLAELADKFSETDKSAMPPVLE
jgi:hypothetical protein